MTLKPRRRLLNGARRSIDAPRIRRDPSVEASCRVDAVNRSPDRDDEKRARLAAALRENLKRRKAQARARRSGDEPAARAGIASPGRDQPVLTLPFRRTGLRRRGLAGRLDGQDPHHRRPAPERQHPDLRRQERRPAADDREPADRRDADAGQRAAPLRRHGAVAHPVQPWRRPHGRGQARRPVGRERPDDLAHRPPDRRHLRALRAGLDHARQLLGDRADPGPHGRGQDLAARRLRHRHAPGRSAADGAGEARRRDRHRERLCARARAQGSEGRARSSSRRSRSAAPTPP